MRLAIYHLLFQSQYLLTSTLMRAQEFYESPVYQGKTFTHEEYMDWYAQDRGRMSYFTDWSGFNLPSTTLDDFVRLNKDLSTKETKLFKRLAKLPRPFYLIATAQKGKSSVLAHEVMHGVYHLRPEYAKEVQTIVSSMPTKKALRSIEKMGYAKSVLVDELNAYTTTGLPSCLSASDMAPLRKRLLGVARQHLGFSVGTKKGLNDLARLAKSITI